MKMIPSPLCAVSRATLLAVASSCIVHAGNGTWVTDGNGDWNTAGNWSGGNVADGASFTANFTNDITADRTVNLDTSGRVIGNLTFSDAVPGTAGSWILSGTNSLQLAGGTITVSNLGTDKTATVSLVITGGNGLTKAAAEN